MYFTTVSRQASQAYPAHAVFANVIISIRAKAGLQKNI